MAFFRGRERGSKFSDADEGGAVHDLCGPVRMDEEGGIAGPVSRTDHCRKPALELAGISDISRFNGPFKPARIRKCANRIGWRQPRHESEQRRCLPAAADKRA